MDSVEKLNIFKLELEKIKNEKCRLFVSNAIVDIVPDYFFEIAASSTGKYHPEYALGDGGLVRHTQAATRIAIGLFEIMNLTADDQDAVIAAILLHDTFKCGVRQEKYTITSHPVVAAEQVRSYAETYDDIEIVAFAEQVSDLILTHMGKWNYDWKTHKPFAPKPSNSIQHFVHMCDYLASRKYLDFKFEEKI